MSIFVNLNKNITVITDVNILVLDDNAQVLEALDLFLGRYYENIFTLTNPNLLLKKTEENSIDILILDMNFAPSRQSGNEGLFWLGEVRKNFPLVEVILITAYGEIDLAVKGMKLGAFDFVLKPWENEKLLATISSAKKLVKAQRKMQLIEGRSQALNRDALETGFVLGESEEMRKILDVIRKVAPTEANVLLLGENGTGKEVLAKEIHRSSNRAGSLFFSFDIAALSESLFESELFGHEKGAFTDAKDLKIGKIEAASGGTLFLDEIGNLPLNLQAKLLTALQNKEIYRVGGSKPIKVNFRLISATNMPIQKLAKEGLFREDLLYRLNTITIEIPPLRNRRKDVLPLTQVYMAYYCRKYDKMNIKLTSSALKKLEAYNWPGNIRELKHAIEKAVILCSGEKLTADDFPFFENIDLGQNKEDIFNLNNMEKLTIQKVIKVCNGNMSHAAEKLGISRNTLYAKMKKYEI